MVEHNKESTIGTRPRCLPVVGESVPPRLERVRHPPWIRARAPTGEVTTELRRKVKELGLNTVCQSASCPNLGECWSHRALTLMILGNVCTRSCRFCNVPTGRPQAVDPREPERVAAMLAELDLNYAVITCVNRDDLADGGAQHWARTIRLVRERCPDLVLEVLTGDFKGSRTAIDLVLRAGPHVFAHNLETVPRLSRQVRVQADFSRSCLVLQHAKGGHAITKTGLMLGLGESMDEVRQVLHQVRDMDVDMLTLGQYLCPSPHHHPVARYVLPEEFAELEELARQLGFRHVVAGPMVRSSYHAKNQRGLVLELLQETPSGNGPGTVALTCAHPALCRNESIGG